jgi:uncharacterized membrane protein YdjX (TVP38/TMEM64 family)
MTIYDLLLLFLGVVLIGLLLSRYDITKPKVFILLVASVAVFLLLFFSIHHHYQKTCIILSGDSMDDIKALILSWGLAAPLMSILLMVLQAVIAPLPAFLITAANGVVFGAYWGTVVSWTGAMIGAFISFLMARMFYRSFSRRIRNHRKGLEYIERFESKYGFKVVLIARLMPFVSFDFISYAAGLSRIGVSSFVVATGLGMLPATIVYTVFGAEMGDFRSILPGSFPFLLWRC